MASGSKSRVQDVCIDEEQFLWCSVRVSPTTIVKNVLAEIEFIHPEVNITGKTIASFDSIDIPVSILVIVNVL